MRFHLNAISQFKQTLINSTSFNANCFLYNQDERGERAVDCVGLQRRNVRGERKILKFIKFTLWNHVLEHNYHKIKEYLYWNYYQICVLHL
jgi:hypothetical protein